jgi:AbrB family looped-hinge helix DNA binding protein
MMHKKFYGSTTVGERGQVVVPAEAREALGLEKGEKLLVFGVQNKAVVLTKLSSFKQVTQEMEKQHQEIIRILEEK